MEHTQQILDSAVHHLSSKELLHSVDVEHLEDRYFSSIYCLKGKLNGTLSEYILKIGTTERPIENEYNVYTLLNDKNISSLQPVYYSNEYNYLITKKRILKELAVVLKSEKNILVKKKYFYNVGEIILELDRKTGSSYKFDALSYSEPVKQNINNLNCLSMVEKRRYVEGMEALSKMFDGVECRQCIVSDFSLVNLHVDENNKLCLVDMGDAYYGNIYENIAYIYLNIRFGSLNQHIQNNNTTKEYFNSFKEGYGLDEIDQGLFRLFQIKHIVMMIDFINNYTSNHTSTFRTTLSKLSNRYLVRKYKRHLSVTIGEKV